MASRGAVWHGKARQTRRGRDEWGGDGQGEAALVRIGGAWLGQGWQTRPGMGKSRCGWVSQTGRCKLGKGTARPDLEGQTGNGWVRPS